MGLNFFLFGALKMDVYGNDGTTHICGTPSLSGIMGVNPFSVVTSVCMMMTMVFRHEDVV